MWTVKAKGEAAMKFYKYGMRLRGFSPGCQPMKNLAGWTDTNCGKYHSLLWYREKLTKDDEKSYELDYLGEDEEPENAI